MDDCEGVTRNEAIAMIMEHGKMDQQQAEAWLIKHRHQITNRNQPFACSREVLRLLAQPAAQPAAVAQRAKARLQASKARKAIEAAARRRTGGDPIDPKPATLTRPD